MLIYIYNNSMSFDKKINGSLNLILLTKVHYHIYKFIIYIYGQI